MNLKNLRNRIQESVNSLKKQKLQLNEQVSGCNNPDNAIPINSAFDWATAWMSQSGEPGSNTPSTQNINFRR